MRREPVGSEATGPNNAGSARSGAAAAGGRPGGAGGALGCRVGPALGAGVGECFGGAVGGGGGQVVGGRRVRRSLRSEGAAVLSIVQELSGHRDLGGLRTVVVPFDTTVLRRRMFRTNR